MRYILRRDTFLEKDKINELVKNDLTWGGSLFGRLLNSTVRLAKLHYDSMMIDGCLENIRNTIYEILRESMNKDLRVKFYRLRIKNLVAQIKDVSLANDRAFPDHDSAIDCSPGTPGNTKLNRLIGAVGNDTDSTATPDILDRWKDLPTGCLIDQLLSEIENSPELRRLYKREELDDLRDIHSDYAIELRRYRWRRCNPGLDLGGDDARMKQWKGRRVVSDSDEVLRREISVKANESISRRIFKRFSEYEEYRALLESKKKKKTEDWSSTSTSNRNINYQITPNQQQQQNIFNIHNSPTFQNNPHFQQQANPSINVNTGSGGGGSGGSSGGGSGGGSGSGSGSGSGGGSITTSTTTIGGGSITTSTTTIAGGTTTTSTTTIAGGTTTTSTTTIAGGPTTTSTTSTTTKKEKYIADIWKSFFPEGLGESYNYSINESKSRNLAAFRLTRDDERELQDLNTRLVRGTFTLSYLIASDAMVRLFNLLTVAYRLFATENIPSGRPGGRVSMFTFQQYQKLGGAEKSSAAGSTTKDAGGEAIIPGPGPWAKVKVYRKFQRFVNELLQDQELRKIFSNINFNYPGSEDKFNDSYNFRLIKENEDPSKKPEIKKGRMGPVLFNLLQDLATPAKCKGEELIDVATREYFGISIPEKIELNNAASKDKNDDTNLNYLRWLEKRVGEFKPGLKFNWCVPVSPKTGFDSNKVKDNADGKLVDKTGSKVIVFITGLGTPTPIDKIKFTHGGVELKFFPVKITFKTPLVANDYHEKNKSNYDGYVDYSNTSTPTPSIYYGYCCARPNNVVWLFYVKLEEPIQEVHFQKVEITPDTFTDLKNPKGDGKSGSEPIKLSTLYDLKNGEIDSHMEKVDSNPNDRANFDSIYDRIVDGTGKTFKEYMEKILNATDVTNHDRLGELIIL
jgi:hypothetical protein